jgi:hypothetical protein
VSTHENKDEFAWDALERELVGDGINRENGRQYQEEIWDYLKTARCVLKDLTTYFVYSLKINWTQFAQKKRYLAKEEHLLPSLSSSIFVLSGWFTYGPAHVTRAKGKFSLLIIGRVLLPEMNASSTAYSSYLPDISFINESKYSRFTAKTSFLTPPGQLVIERFSLNSLIRTEREARILLSK